MAQCETTHGRPLKDVVEEILRTDREALAEAVQSLSPDEKQRLHALVERISTLSSMPEDVARDVEKVRDAITSGEHSPGCEARKRDCQCHLADALTSADRLASAAAQVSGLAQRCITMDGALVSLREYVKRAESERDALKESLENVTGDRDRAIARIAQLERAQVERIVERDAAREQLRDLARENERLHMEASHTGIRLERDAGRLADEVAALVRRGVVDARSPVADALQDFRAPPSTERADRLAALTSRVEESDKQVATLRRRLEAKAVDELAVQRLKARVAELERRSWIQCTTVSNECLAGCRSMQEHDRCRQKELMTECENLSPLVVLHEDMVRLKREAEARATSAEAKVARLEADNRVLETQRDSMQAERNRALDYQKALRERFDTSRNDALEEAARRVETEAQESHTREVAAVLDDVAHRIRDLKSQPAPAPASGLREAVGPRITATERLVEVARRLSGGANNRIVWDDLEVALAAYDAAKGGEAPSQWRWSRAWKVLARQYRGAENYYRAMRNGYQKLFTENKEKARKWDAAVERAAWNHRVASQYLNAGGRQVHPGALRETVRWLLHGEVTGLDTPPSEPGGGEPEQEQGSWDSYPADADVPEEAPSAPLTPGTSHTEECEANEDDTDGNAGPCTCAPPIPESLAAVAREALGAFDATKRPGHPDSVVPLLRARDEALEQLRRALSGNAPRVLREERVVEVLANLLRRYEQAARDTSALRESAMTADIRARSEARHRGCVNGVQDVAEALNLTLPGGEPAPRVQSLPEWQQHDSDCEPQEAGPWQCVPECPTKRARIAPTPQPAFDHPAHDARYAAENPPPPEPTAPQVVWEGDGVRVMSDGTWATWLPVLNEWTPNAHGGHRANPIARALAEAKREARDSHVGRLVRQEMLRGASRAAAEAQRKVCADAVLAGPVGVDETRGEVHARVANVPLVTG